MNNIVQYHKRFREVAINRKMDQEQQRILNETTAQQKFDVLNSDIDSRIKEATKRATEAFEKLADAMRVFREGGKRAGKTKLTNEVFDDVMFQKANLKYQQNRCKIFGHTLDMATGTCNRCGFKFIP